MPSKFVSGLEVIVVMWTMMCSKAKAESCNSLFWVPEVEDKNYLEGHVIKRMFTQTESLCRIMCFTTDTCVSYNYKRDTTECEISDSDHIQHPKHFVQKAGYVYVGTENGCQNNSCPINSTCRTDLKDETKRHWCVCPPGYQGTICNQDIDECKTRSEKCPEFSTCKNTLGSFHCSCNVGYKMNESKCVVDPKIVCEGDEVRLNCYTGKVLNIYWALYGRSSKNECIYYDKNKMQMPCGDAKHSLQTVKGRCQGHQTCSFSSSNHVFSDPCPNNHKYIEMKYNCTSP